MVLQLTCNDNVHDTFITRLHADLFGNAAGFYSFILGANARERVPNTIGVLAEYSITCCTATTKNKQDPVFRHINHRIHTALHYCPGRYSMAPSIKTFFDQYHNDHGTINEMGRHQHTANNLSFNNNQ